MPDKIGNIDVPTIAAFGVFPIVPDFPWGRALDPDVVIHQFGAGDVKREQRFLLGSGAREFIVRRQWLTDANRIALKNFFDAHYGPYGAFTYNLPSDDGTSTTPVTCRFKDEPLGWQMVADWACSIGVTLVEIPSTNPSYQITATQTRFPTGSLPAALLSQRQELFPLIKLTALQEGYPVMYLSDRRCKVGVEVDPTARQQYLPRLLSWDGIQQSMGNDADQATFTFGNADRVMRDLINDVDLYRADVEFSLFHVGTGVKLDLWKGDIVDWSLDCGPEFKVTASDGAYELNLAYPTRKTSRTCVKVYKSQMCPYATAGALDLVHFPSADASFCDKNYDTPNGCLAHGMKRYYGGIIATPQSVVGFSREGGSPILKLMTSTSVINDSVYDTVVPEVYTDYDMPVQCKIAAGRDESEFYEALGIVCEGPIGAYTFPAMKDNNNDGVDEYVGPEIDGQAYHGFPSSGLGLRWYLGNDPAGAYDYFSLDQAGNETGGNWRKVYHGSSTYLDNFAAGTAFIVLRVSDAKGLQLKKPGEHTMSIHVREGMGCWVWTAPGARSFVTGVTNPVWIAVNMLLRARGFRAGASTTSDQLDVSEKLFDVSAAVAAAAICNRSVTSLVYGTYRVWVEDTPYDPDTGAPATGHWENQAITNETQFKFRGIIKDEKPLRDWIQEVLMNCLGYYTFAFGKLKIGIRCSSSTTEDFSEGNILFRSLRLTPRAPSYNHLTASFADSEFSYTANSVNVYDEEHALAIGVGGPQFLRATINLSGTYTKSQAARIVATRLREEIGGIDSAERKKARKLSFKTTVLALNVEPGTVASMSHEDMPGGTGEFRVTGWRLNPDYSIDVTGNTSTDSMYNLVDGPKPADVGTVTVLPGTLKEWSVTDADVQLEAVNQVLTVYAATRDCIVTLPQESTAVGKKMTIVRGQGSRFDVRVRVYVGSGDEIDIDGAGPGVVAETEEVLSRENDYLVVEGA